MKTLKQDLGKVSVTCNGVWDAGRNYDRLCIVNDGNFASYISKKFAPEGILLSNEEYWQPIASLRDDIKIDYDKFKKEWIQMLAEIQLKLKASRIVVENDIERESLSWLQVAAGCEVYVKDTKLSWILESIVPVLNYKEWRLESDSKIDSVPTYELTGEFENLIADRTIADRWGHIIDEYYVTRDMVTNFIIETVRKYIHEVDILPGSIKPEDLSQAVLDLIGYGQITNLADEEDLTDYTNANGTHVLRFKDKVYNEADGSGLGRVYLRKNKVQGVNTLVQQMIDKPNTIYIVQYDYTLGEQTITIPDNCVLQFEGGSINNGTINFNNCNIDNIGNSIILNNCTLKGSLNKQVIYSDWFYFNSDDCTDTLSNVFKISEGCRLIISEGVYKVSVKNLIGTDYADPMNTSILQPQSNSHITINGTIQLISNDRTHYNIIGIIDKDNILLDGTGEIIGDVETHTGTTGEWGHGVLISGSRNISVKDLRISYCWGDGLSVSYAEKILTDKGLVNSPYSPPEIINITNIKSSYNRRLGISIINGDGIILENSITEGNGTINGTSPKAGLDIEPNPNQSVNNVIVSGCLFYDNVVTYFPSNGLIEDKAISCIIQNSICKKQVTIGNVGKVIGCEIKYLLINGSRFVNIQNNVITEALVLSGTTITGLNVIDNTFLGLTTDGYDSCIRVSCDSFSKVNIASNNFSLCTNSNMRKLVTYTKKQTNAIDIVDSVITYDKTLTLLFYPYANFYNCEFIFSGFNIYNITSELDKYPDSCSFIGCKFAANNSSFYIRDNITDNYKITIENCEYYTKQDNPTDFINYIGHTIALDLVVLNNKGKSVFLKNDIDEAHKRPIINNNYNGHRFYNITNKRPEYYYNNNWWDSCGYNVNENRNSDGTLIEKVRIVSDSSKIVNSNIRYVIVSDIDLQGETLTIPAGCTLDFQGGSLSNGTIIGNDTKIINNLSYIFKNVEIQGVWNVSEVYPEWFGAKGDGVTDDTISLQMALDFPVKSYRTVCLLDRVYLIGTRYGDLNVMLFINSNTTILSNTFGTIKVADHLVDSGVEGEHYYTIIGPKNEDISYIENVTIKNLIFDHNGSNNLLSIWTSRNNAIRILKGNNIEIINCEFKDNTGLQYIVLGDNTDVGIGECKILNCDFSNSGASILGNTENKDHSSIYYNGTGILISNCNFINRPFSELPKSPGNCAIELHGGYNNVSSCKIINYTNSIIIAPTTGCKSPIAKIDNCIISGHFGVNIWSYGDYDLEEVDLTNSYIELIGGWGQVITTNKSISPFKRLVLDGCTIARRGPNQSNTYCMGVDAAENVIISNNNFVDCITGAFRNTNRADFPNFKVFINNNKFSGTVTESFIYISNVANQNVCDYFELKDNYFEGSAVSGDIYIPTVNGGLIENNTFNTTSEKNINNSSTSKILVFGKFNNIDFFKDDRSKVINNNRSYIGFSNKIVVEEPITLLGKYENSIVLNEANNYEFTTEMINIPLAINIDTMNIHAHSSTDSNFIIYPKLNNTTSFSIKISQYNKNEYSGNIVIRYSITGYKVYT